MSIAITFEPTEPARIEFVAASLAEPFSGPFADVKQTRLAGAARDWLEDAGQCSTGELSRNSFRDMASISCTAPVTKLGAPMGRPPIGKHAMTDAERQRRRRERLKSKPASKPEPPRPTAPQPDARSQREDALQQALATMTRERDHLRREVEALRASPPEPQWMENQLRGSTSDKA